MPAYGEKKEHDTRRFVPSTRSILYALAWFFIFGFTCGNLGLISSQIHKYGKWPQNYASLEYKNSLGLMLTGCLISLILVFSHPWLENIGVATFVCLILAVFFGTGAGIVQRTTPFKGTSCNKPADMYPEKWQRFAGECKIIVGIQGTAWALFALYTMMIFGNLAYKLSFRVKPTPGRWYAANP